MGFLTVVSHTSLMVSAFYDIYIGTNIMCELLVTSISIVDGFLAGALQYVIVHTVPVLYMMLLKWVQTLEFLLTHFRNLFFLDIAQCLCFQYTPGDLPVWLVSDVVIQDRYARLRAWECIWGNNSGLWSCKWTRSAWIYFLCAILWRLMDTVFPQ